MTRDEYLAFWRIPPERADVEWAAKQRLDAGFLGVAPMAIIARDIRYDSPIDGKPITSKHARIEDLKRNNCVEYDPGMKQDYQRRIVEGESKLERSVDESVERMVSRMDSRQKEKLTAEVEGGLTPEPTRTTWRQ